MSTRQQQRIRRIAAGALAASSIVVAPVGVAWADPVGSTTPGGTNPSPLPSLGELDNVLLQKIMEGRGDPFEIVSNLLQRGQDSVNQNVK